MDRITYLIEKFWRGLATDEEKQEILRYLEQHDSEWKVRMEQAFLADEQPQEDMDPERAEQVFDQIQSVAGIEGNQAPVRRIGTFVRIAAAVVVLMMFGWGLSVYLKNQQITQELASTSMMLPDTTIHRNLGLEERAIFLEDGSKVLLTPGSSIAYEADFDIDKRDVFLEGEATFEVAKDTLRPFTVWAEGYSTTALGTTFSVSAHHADVFKVNLISGKVLVRSSINSTVSLSDVYLEPGEELSVNPLSGLWAVSAKNSPVKVPPAKKKPQIVKEEKNPEAIADGSGLLVFDKTPLNEVFARIARAYNAPIDLSHVDVSQLSFTGDFDHAIELDAVMAIICNMNDLVYYKEEDVIRIEINKE